MRNTTAKKNKENDSKEKTGIASSALKKNFGVVVPFPYTKEQENDLVVRYMSLARRIAWKISTRLPATVQVDDLIQAGMVGLIAASRNYDPTLGAGFGTYAGIRITGEILDEVRRGDWTPRSVHRKERLLSDAKFRIECEKLSAATDVEIAEELGMDTEQYHKIKQDTQGCRIFHIEDEDEIVFGPLQSVDKNEPLELLLEEEFGNVLADTVKKLKVKEQQVVELAFAGKNLRETGEALGLTESRICQMRNELVGKLRRFMQPHI